MLRAAADQYRRQQAISSTTTAVIRRAWSRMGNDFDASWPNVGPSLVSVLETGRRSAVAAAIAYTPAVLRETGQTADPIGVLNPALFVSTAPDGRRTQTLMREALIKAKTAVAGGATGAEALDVAGRWLTMTTLTVLADTRREVYGADIIQRPTLTGYARMLNPPSCSRCIALAGKWFRWNTGFNRHPRCDCQHVPGAESVVGDLRVDPRQMFESMSPGEQDATFGAADAQAIRDGADIARVVNVRGRGMPTVRSAVGWAPAERLTVDDIYLRARSRADAITLLRDQGFIRS